MHQDSVVWKRISVAVIQVGYSPCPQDAQSRKTKWHQIFLDYKQLVDRRIRSGVNSLEF